MVILRLPSAFKLKHFLYRSAHSFENCFENITLKLYGHERKVNDRKNRRFHNKKRSFKAYDLSEEYNLSRLYDLSQVNNLAELYDLVETYDLVEACDLSKLNDPLKVYDRN